jgi:hypothetical protein
MENREKKQALWKEAIPRMNEEDLEFLLDFSECFDPKLVKMAKARYTELTKPQDDEEIHVAVVDSLASDVFEILEEMECTGEYDKDGEIVFSYKDSNFYITTYEDNHQFIEIWEYSWKRINMNNIDEVTKAYRAINFVNCMGDISVSYSFNDNDEMCIHFGTRTLFFAHIPNRKGYLEYLLERFFDAHKFFEHKMQTFYEKEHPSERAN